MTKPPATLSATPLLDDLVKREPDLVDRIFEYLLSEVPEIGAHVAGSRLQVAKQAVRDEFAGRRVYIPVRPADDAGDLAATVLSLFNGRNATEVGRRLQISRATVYRLLKQSARKKTVSALPRNETAQQVRSRNRSAS